MKLLVTPYDIAWMNIISCGTAQEKMNYTKNCSKTE